MPSKTFKPSKRVKKNPSKAKVTKSPLKRAIKITNRKKRGAKREVPPTIDEGKSFGGGNSSSDDDDTEEEASFVDRLKINPPPLLPTPTKRPSPKLPSPTARRRSARNARKAKTHDV